MPANNHPRVVEHRAIYADPNRMALINEDALTMSLRRERPGIFPSSKLNVFEVETRASSLFRNLVNGLKNVHWKPPRFLESKKQSN